MIPFNPLRQQQATGRELRRALVADAHHLERERVLSALSEEYDVTFASGEDETVEAIQQAMPDLLIAEVELAQGNGFALCERVRALPHTERLPILLLTRRAAMPDKIAGFQAGADDYVVKPLDARLFHARIRLLCRIKRLEGPHDIGA